MIIALTFQLCFASYSQLGSDINSSNTSSSMGHSVAVSGDGTRMIVGSPSYDSLAGRVDIYDYDGSSWTRYESNTGGQPLKEGANVQGARYCGESVSISDDGSRVAFIEEHGIYVYEDNGNGTWGQIKQMDITLLGSLILEATINDRIMKVALSGDGSTLAIGVLDAADSKGKVRVFDIDNDTWLIPYSQFGNFDGFKNEYRYRVALNYDGTKLVFGGPGKDSNQGRVVLYEYNGSSWDYLASWSGNASGDYFGSSVALNHDGTTVAMGAAVGNYAKVVRYEGGTWQLPTTLSGSASEYFGGAVSLSYDGTRFAIGGYGGNGVVRVYDYVYSTAFGYSGYVWKKVGSDLAGDSSGDFFGVSLALSQYNARLVVGASEDNSFAGQVKVFQDSSEGSCITSNPGWGYCVYNNTNYSNCGSLSTSVKQYFLNGSSVASSSSFNEVVTTDLSSADKAYLELGKVYIDTTYSSTGYYGCQQFNLKYYENSGGSETTNLNFGTISEGGTHSFQTNYGIPGNFSFKIGVTTAGSDRYLVDGSSSSGKTLFFSSLFGSCFGSDNSSSDACYISTPYSSNVSTTRSCSDNPYGAAFDCIQSSDDPFINDGRYINCNTSPPEGNVNNCHIFSIPTPFSDDDIQLCITDSENTAEADPEKPTCESISHKRSYIVKTVTSEPDIPINEKGDTPICQPGGIDCNSRLDGNEAITIANDLFGIYLNHPLIAPSGDGKIIKHKLINDDPNAEVGLRGYEYSEVSTSIAQGSSQTRLVLSTNFNRAGYLWCRVKFLEKWYYFRIFLKPAYFTIDTPSGTQAGLPKELSSLAAYNHTDPTTDPTALSNWKKFSSATLRFDEGWPSYTASLVTTGGTIDSPTPTYVTTATSSELKNYSSDDLSNAAAAWAGTGPNAAAAWAGTGPSLNTTTPSFKYDDVARLTNGKIDLVGYHGSLQTATVPIQDKSGTQLFDHEVHPYKLELTYDSDNSSNPGELEFEESTSQQTLYSKEYFYANTRDGSTTKDIRWKFKESNRPTFTLKAKNLDGNYLKNYFPASGYTINAERDGDNVFSSNLTSDSFNSISLDEMQFIRDSTDSVVNFTSRGDFVYTAKFNSGVQSTEYLTQSPIKVNATFTHDDSVNSGLVVTAKDKDKNSPVEGQVNLSPIYARWGRTVAPSNINIDDLTADKKFYKGYLDITLQYKDDKNNWQDEKRIAFTSSYLSPLNLGDCFSVQDGSNLPGFYQGDYLAYLGRISYLVVSENPDEAPSVNSKALKKCYWSVTDPFEHELNGKIIFGTKSYNQKGILFELGQ